jgi:hypothetical protein
LLPFKDVLHPEVFLMYATKPAFGMTSRHCDWIVRGRGLPQHPDDLALAILSEAWSELCGA